MTRWVGKVFLVGVVVPMLSLPTMSAYAKHRARPVPDRTSSAYGSSDGPAHMIEIRPGYWVSSYACTIDDGNGRLITCDSIRGGGI